MKKLKLVCLAVLAAVTLFSCKDETGDFVEQLYTNSQKSAAIKACLKTSADSALNHLCDNNGFYEYLEGEYRINYASLQNSLFDTLNNHGYSYLVDSLILSTNRLAASCKSQISPSITTAIDSLVIVDYDALIDGNATAITDYFKIYQYPSLKSAFQSPVSIRLNLYGVSPVWNEMVLIYMLYNPTPLNFDLQNYIIEKMLDGILEEMRVEEALIRTDSTHRSEKTKMLGE
jgi:hypothetical protein